MKRPLPTASIRPSCGFSLAVSGRTIPLLVRSSRSTGLITTRSPSGRKRMFEPSLTVAISTLIARVLIIAEPGTAYKGHRPCQGSPARVRSGQHSWLFWEEGSMKRVVRLLVLLLPVALLAGTVPASANDEAGYLALGDSVAFGFSPLVSPTDTDAYVGYPEVLSKHVVNAACSGETSGSLIAGPPDNGCAAFRSVAPLHASYTGTQLGFAVGYIRAHPDTQLVTIDIGGNDLFVLLATCGTSSSCFSAGFPALLSALANNLAIIYGSLRAAGFRGHLVALTYYLTNYNDANQLGALGAINQVVATVTTAFRG